MKICVPSESDLGLEATVAAHLGRAPFLTLVDTDSRQVSVLPNTAHEGHACAPAERLAGRGVGAVVCAGAGKRSVATLSAAGIEVLLTGAPRVADALEALRRGELQPLSARDACAGHGAGHGGGCTHRS